jgi:hypothetical protein
MTQNEMVEEFQCPGCTCGGPKTCEQLKIKEYSPGFCCGSHSAGTFLMGFGRLALGLPKGFCRYGPGDKLEIRLHSKGGAKTTWDHLNVAVWAMVKDGFLFVRTYSPRVNHCAVDVVEGGDLGMVPGAIDASKFMEEID